MSFILDYVGSIAIGALVLLALLGFYASLGETASTQNASAIVKRNLNAATEIIEYDFQRMGYRIDDSVKVTRLDSSQIVFRYDMNDDGLPDSVKYTLGSVKSPDSANPRTRILYRTINNQAPQTVDAGVTRFAIKYFNASGGTTSVHSKVRSVGVFLGMQTILKNDSVETGIVWEKVIRPKNLR